MDQFVTDLLGETTFIKEDMNMGLRGKIRAVRWVQPSGRGGHDPNFGYRLSVQIIEGAAAGDMIDLRIDQIKFEAPDPRRVSNWKTQSTA